MYICYRGMKNVTSILLAFIVLFVSTGFTESKHFCGDELKSISYILKAEVCNHKKETKEEACHKQAQEKKCCPKKKVIKKDNCCTTTFSNYQLDSDYISSFEKVKINKQQFDFVIAYVYAVLSTFEVEATSKKYIQYNPPQMYRDIPILIQSFLI